MKELCFRVETPDPLFPSTANQRNRLALSAPHFPSLDVAEQGVEGDREGEHETGGDERHEQPGRGSGRVRDGDRR